MVFETTAAPLPKAADVLKNKRSKRRSLAQQSAQASVDEDRRSFSERFESAEAKGKGKEGDGIDEEPGLRAAYVRLRELGPFRFLPKPPPAKDMSAIDYLQTITWGCLYALIAWEVYINSPFFERAAPMAPVVY